MTEKRPRSNTQNATTSPKRPRKSAPKATSSIGTLTGLHDRQNMTGQLPSFNDWHEAVVDHDNGYLYLYGGIRPADCDIVPTSDLHRCNIQTMEWANLTDRLRFRLRPDNEATQRLPALHQPATALVSLTGKTFIYIFGGRDIGNNNSSNLLAIDTDNLEWSVVQVDGGPVTPRIAAGMTAVGDKLYIFGGDNELTRDDDNLLASYSIAKYNQEADRWTWVVRDQPYPPHVPELGYQLLVTPVYGGKKLLLMPGRESRLAPITLSGDKTVLFHATHHTFQVQSDTAGTFPQSAAWYLIAPSPPVGSKPIRSRNQDLSLAHASTTASGSRASDNRHPESPSELSAMTAASNSVLVCAWLPHGKKSLVPEIWRYMLPPDEECRCLNVRKKVWDLDLDLQSFVVVGHQAFLMGYSGDDHDHAVWDVCVELNFNDTTPW